MNCREHSWEDLAEQVHKLGEAGRIETTWLAYEGSEDYGIWLLRPRGPELEERRATFGLFAAHAIRKDSIPPSPVPDAAQHCPHWKAQCELEEEFARRRGKCLDFSDAVPFGLGKPDVDAVDPCTRAWLELLRRKSPAFRITCHGTETIKGNQYPTLGGTIDNLCAASATYLKARARDEIGNQLVETGGAHVAGVSKRSSPKEIVDAAKRTLGYSYEKFAGRIGISKDTLYAITLERRWVSDGNYSLLAQICNCRPEDLHPRELPSPKRRFRR